MEKLERMIQIGNIVQRALFVSGIGIQVFRDLLGTRTLPLTNDEQSTNNIVIVGGDLSNKGAQAMTFTAVDQMARRYPQHNIYLFSTLDFKRPDQEKERYRFKILPWGVNQRLTSLLNPLASSITPKYFDDIDAEVEKIFSNSEFIVDISGYALSSQWGFERSFSYISNIILARKKSVPFYILPQSIGPFDFGLIQKPFLNILLNLYLPYPKIICPREQEGVKELSLYTTHNVQREFDIVLQNDSYVLTNIFRDSPTIDDISISDNSTGVVPNSKVRDRMVEAEFYELYDHIITTLLDINKNVYILCHSDKDVELCESIYTRFDEEEQVHLITDHLDAIELESVIQQFDFLVGSRYHSLIHSYKNDRPVIAIGWATKYRELLDDFDQSKYFFESRANIDKGDLKRAIIELDDSYTIESTNIAQRRSEILRNDVFERLFSQPS